MDEDIRRTLKWILEYIGVDIKYADYAELHSQLENLIKRHGGNL